MLKNDGFKVAVPASTSHLTRLPPRREFMVNLVSSLCVACHNVRINLSGYGTSALPAYKAAKKRSVSWAAHSRQLDRTAPLRQGRNIIMRRSFSGWVVRAGTSRRLPRSQPRRWPSFAAPFSTQQLAPHPTSTITMQNANPSVDTAYLLDKERQVEVDWQNGHQSFFDWTWLRVNCPSFLHESGQRTVFPGDVDPEVKPVQVKSYVQWELEVQSVSFGFREPTPPRMFRNTTARFPTGHYVALAAFTAICLVPRVASKPVSEPKHLPTLHASRLYKRGLEI